MWFSVYLQRNPPSRTTIHECREIFMATSIVLSKQKACPSSRSFADVKLIQKPFHCSPRKSSHIAKQQLRLMRWIIHGVVNKQLQVYVYTYWGAYKLHSLISWSPMKSLDVENLQMVFNSAMLHKTWLEQSYRLMVSTLKSYNKILHNWTFIYYLIYI